jgi:hypothetical protein
MMLFWAVPLYGLVGTYRFAGTYCLHIQGWSKQDWKCVIRTGIHACVLCRFWGLLSETIFKEQILIKDYISYFSFQLYKLHGLNVFFKHCKSIRIRQRRVSSVVANWSRMLEAMGSNAGQFTRLFPAAAMF